MRRVRGGKSRGGAKAKRAERGLPGEGALLSLLSMSLTCGRTHNTQVLEECLAKGADANMPHQINGKGPVDLALECGNAPAIRLLLRASDLSERAYGGRGILG